MVGTGLRFALAAPSVWLVAGASLATASLATALGDLNVS